MNFIQALQTKNTVTENGMAAHSSTGNANLDFFGAAPRNNPKLVNLFRLALEEDATIALSALFQLRDPRGGKGERKAFCDCFNLLSNVDSTVAKFLLPMIPVYGRWKDVLDVMTPPVEAAAIQLIQQALVGGDNLCAKWMPRKGPIAAKLRYPLSERDWRKFLTNSFSKTVETHMCAKKWGAINYEQVPSRAAMIYRKAFTKNDGVRYAEYLKQVNEGKKTIKASVLHPHELVSRVMNSFGVDETLEAQWRALPNYVENTGEKWFPLVDVSASMSGQPMEVAIALGLYVAERNAWPFKNAFITFESNPALLVIPNKTLYEKVSYIQRTPWGGSTNLEKAFSLILDQAVKNGLPASEMPTKLLILSDMQFNSAVGASGNPTALEMISEKFKKAGYTRPNIVFWNLRATSNVPVKFDEKGTAFVSGFSPSIMKALLGGAKPEQFTPFAVMTEALAPYRTALLDRVARVFGEE